MRAIRLRTEYLKDPIGIDIEKPRFMWNCEGGIKQSAYQIFAVINGKSGWDSGKVKSSSMQCAWEGEMLKSRSRVVWKVLLWDENDNSGEWSEAYFETGLLEKEDWTAKWISGDYVPKTRRNILRAYTGGKAVRYPVDCFQRSFRINEIASARLYITACGLYEACINGRRVGDFVLAPGYTDYRKRVQYQTYDVTDLLSSGDNTIKVMLADGWYRGSVGAWGCLCEYGHETKLIVQLEIKEPSGKVTAICTDGMWEWSNDGPICFADNKDGEIFDARMLPSYNGHAKETSHPVVPSASNNVRVTEHETFKPEVITTPSGKTVLDFSQNIAGYISFALEAKAGQRIFMSFGEMLDENGEFTQKNIQLNRKDHTTPLQQVEYFCKDGRNIYKTRFAVFGFRYVLIDTDVKWSTEDFTAIAVYSDLERTGYFESSNDLLNKFVENTLWSSKGNHIDIPTDCPTRERHGWTGDIQVFQNTAQYLFDYAPFARKYLHDLYDWQKQDGKLPQIAPYGGVDFFMAPMNGSVGWSDVGILMPYRMWKQYGDTKILRDSYDGMKKYAGFMMKRIGKKYITAKNTGLSKQHRSDIVNAGQSFGEWAEPEDVHKTDWLRDMSVPHPEESTAYTSFVLKCMAGIAETLGMKKDAWLFRHNSERVRSGYRELRKIPGFTLDTDRQASLVRPLYMKLLDEEQEEYAKKRLIKAMDNYGWRIGTGFLSTPLILYVLSDIDADHAYRLLENEDMPGWLFMPKSGADTIWESWEGTKAQGGIASLNHYSKGAMCEWLFSSMCGIRISGENSFVIEPVPGGSFTYARARYQSIYGIVESGWTRENGQTVYRITIPANCTAEIRLPRGRHETARAGTYVFEEN